MSDNNSLLRQGKGGDGTQLIEDEPLQQMSFTDLSNYFVKEEQEKEEKLNNSKNGKLLNTPSISNSDISILDTASQSFKSSGAKRAKIHKCSYPNCGKSFTRPSILKEHIHVKHLNIRKYKCDECGLAYTKKLHLQRHYISSHAIEDKPFACSFCNKKLLTKQHLETHERTHVKPFKCEFNDQCDAGFTTAKLLETHIQRAHVSKHEERLTCQFCKKKYQSPSKLRQHLLKGHNSDNQQLTEKIEKDGNSAFDNNLLILQKSLKQKKYQCSSHGCSKSFNTWSLLQQHMKNDHPKLQCLICNKKCVGEQGLQMHMMIHDENMSNKIWKCLICENKFAKKLELVDHCKEIHQLDIDQHKQFLTKIEENEEENKMDEDLVNTMDDYKKSITIKKKVRKTDVDLWKSNIKILNKIDNGDSMAEVLLNSIGKKYECRIKNCYRKFKRKENYETHLKKHEEYIEKMALINDTNACINEK